MENFLKRIYCLFAYSKKRECFYNDRPVILRSLPIKDLGTFTGRILGSSRISAAQITCLFCKCLHSFELYFYVVVHFKLYVYACMFTLVLIPEVAVLTHLMHLQVEL